VFLIASVLVGVGFAGLLGGRLSRLGEVRFRLGWTVGLALAVQIVLFSRLGEDLPTGVETVGHLGTYALLVAFAAANLRIRALVPALVGMLLNAAAILANGGRMPLHADAARAAGLSLAPHANVSGQARHLAFLGDVFALPASLPFANAFSPGDVLIGVGVAAFIVVVCVDESGARAVDPRRLAAPLRVGGYRLLLSGRLVSHLGDWLTLAALVGWIYQRTGSTANVALLMVVRLGPPILGGGVASLVVDRLPKPRLLGRLELMRGLVVVAALVCVTQNRIVGVFAALALSGGLAAVEGAAAAALVPTLLPNEELASANAGLEIAKDAAMAVGAVGGGLAVSHVGVSTALAVDAATFLLAGALLSRLIVPAATREAAAGGGRPAIRYVLRRRRLLLLILSFSAATVATGLANATLPRFLGGPHGFGGSGYGYGMAALAAGLALGEAAVGLTRVGPGSGRWMGVGLLLLAGLFVLLGLTTHAPTALLLLGAIGFVDGTTDVLFSTLVQRETGPAHCGAAFGFAGAVMTTTMMAAFVTAPALNAAVSAGSVLLGASSFLAVGGVIALAAMRRPAVPAASPVAA
jgi:Family of unknown function (DUF5317)/Major Facilitator Superfamily